MRQALLVVYAVLVLGYCSQVYVIPRDFFISTPGGSAEFRCIVEHPTLLEIEWIVNGSRLEALELTGFTVEFSRHFGVGVLNFENLPLEYNGTFIRCMARFITALGETESSISPGATLLLLQGILTTVRSLSLTVQDSALASLNWREPPRLSNPDGTPEVSYCVEVINASTSAETVLISQCDISDVQFNFTIPPFSWCYLYVVIVTPVNSVGNGVQRAVSYFGTEISPQLQELTRVAAESDVLTYSLIMAAPVCTFELTFQDRNRDDEEALVVLTETHQDTDIFGNMITFTTEQLTPNRLYALSVAVRNIAGRISTIRTISTHDVKTASIDRLGSKVSADYDEHSTARGALFSLVFVTENEEVDFGKSYLLALDRNSSHNHTLPFLLSTGRYVMHVHDIEEDGTLFASDIGYPAVTVDRTISGSSQGQSFQAEYVHLESCRLTGSAGYIEVQCSYPSDSMATGFQVVARSTQFSEVHKLHKGKTSSRLNSVTLRVGDNGEYQVSIFAIVGELGILNTNVEYHDHINLMKSTDSTEISEITTLGEEITTLGEGGVQRDNSANTNINITLIIVLSTIVGVLIIVIIVILLILFGVRWRSSKARSRKNNVSQQSSSPGDIVCLKSESRDSRLPSLSPEEPLEVESEKKIAEETVESDEDDDGKDTSENKLLLSKDDSNKYKQGTVSPTVKSTSSSSGAVESASSSPTPGSDKVVNEAATSSSKQFVAAEVEKSTTIAAGLTQNSSPLQTKPSIEVHNMDPLDESHKKICDNPTSSHVKQSAVEETCLISPTPELQGSPATMQNDEVQEDSVPPLPVASSGVPKSAVEEMQNGKVQEEAEDRVSPLPIATSDAPTSTIGRSLSQEASGSPCIPTYVYLDPSFHPRTRSQSLKNDHDYHKEVTSQQPMKREVDFSSNTLPRTMMSRHIIDSKEDTTPLQPAHSLFQENASQKIEGDTFPNKD